MAEVNVVINTESHDIKERGKFQNIGASIDTPNNVTFIDGATTPNDTYINYIMTEADGAVEVRPFGDATGADKYTMYLVKGGWHECPLVGYIYGDDGNTDTGLGIRVRI